MSRFQTQATVDNLSKVLEFVDDELSANDCPPKVMMQIDVAVEEMYVNVANYAYKPGTGSAEIEMDFSSEDGGSVTITIIDSGEQFDPLKKPDPDVTLSADEREIGGLGIFMVKKSMDDVRYEYRNGQNRFTMFKRFAVAG